MANKKKTTEQLSKKSSTRPSLTGGLLSFIALATAAVGYAFAKADFKTVQNAHGVTVNSDVVTRTTGRTFAVLMSLPFIIGAIIIASLAIFLTIMRLRRVKVGGLILSLLWVILSIWAIHVALAGFHAIDGH